MFITGVCFLFLIDTHCFKSKARFRRRTSHEPNRMQMSKILCSPSFAFDSAHVKYGVWTWPKSASQSINFREKPYTQKTTFLNEDQVSTVNIVLLN